MYALYALLFADHGLDTAQISSLLFFWSVTAFVFEVPSGAWADTVSRRLLLMVAPLLVGTGFAVWTVFPSYLGFALGFVLWGIGGSLQSGTYQALVYDELAARGAAREYPRIIGFAASAAELGALLGILSAAPLFAWGGYLLVGWVSVVVAVVQALIAATFPAAPKAEPVIDAAPVGGYLTMLRAGLTEVLRRKTVRHGVLLASLLYGFTAFDEYFGLLAEENGAATEFVPILIGLTVAGSLIGAAVAGATARMTAATMAGALVVSGITLALGALLGGGGAVGVVGFALIGLGYGIISNAIIVSDARLQDSIEGPARATVTSASGLASEVVGLAVFGFFALGSIWLDVAPMVALCGVPVALAAVVALRWLPPIRTETVDQRDADR